MVEINYLEKWKILPESSNSYVYGKNQNHTEDWALGCHPRDNGHVTH